MGTWTRLLDNWDRDWKAASFNGLNLVSELSAHSAAAAASDANLDGYTVWGVALHVHKFKEMLLAALENREPEYFEGDEDFPSLPDGGLTEKRWIGAIHTMNDIHDALIAKARTLDEVFLDTTFEPWDMAWGDVFAWAATHDGYHTAQIRNMKR